MTEFSENELRSGSKKEISLVENPGNEEIIFIKESVVIDNDFDLANSYLELWKYFKVKEFKSDPAFVGIEDEQIVHYPGFKEKFLSHPETLGIKVAIKFNHEKEKIKSKEDV